MTKQDVTAPDYLNEAFAAAKQNFDELYDRPAGLRGYSRGGGVADA